LAELRAESLLKSALEKIVYFEARSEQLARDLEGARADAERLKGELAGAAQHEISLRRQIAELEVQVERAHREREEIGRLNDVLKAERQQWLDKLLDSARIQAAGEGMDGLDLASFIATLRSEVITRPVKSGSPVTTAPSPMPVARAPQSDVAAQAERWLEEGRLKPSEAEVIALSKPRGHTEQTLFGFSVRELSSPDGPARIRAAERLRALGDRAAAPALATALHAERDGKVTIALLAAFSELAQAEGAEVVVPLLAASSSEVRIAALKALLAIDPVRAAPHLGQACRDPDPWVRRRASLLSLNRPAEEAARLSSESAHDEDRKVRRLSTLALAAASPGEARAGLLEALDDGDAEVRAAAARSLSRLLGEDLSPLLALDPLQRRREIRRLAQLPLVARRAPVDVRPVKSPVVTAAARPSLPTHAHPGPTPAVALSAPRVAVAVVAAPTIDEALCAAVLSDLRGAIRGRTAEELCEGRELSAVAEACAALVARGQAVRRGRKLFVA
jgi:hypothetical protein